MARTVLNQVGAFVSETLNALNTMLAELYAAPGVTTARTAAQIDLLVQGIAAGYKVARGTHQQAAASDTIVTGLATVVAVVAIPQNITVKQLFFQASIGDQAGTPAAGSILITSKKPTAVNDVTPTAATDFTDNIIVDWIAIGT